MTTYTTEDFEKAQFAKHPHGATATRDNAEPWQHLVPNPYREGEDDE